MLVLTGCSNLNNSSKKVSITSTPTLFFHGGGSSYHAEEHMVDAAKKAGVTESVIRAEVSKTGKVTLVGTWAKDAKNPICEVNYENNRQLNFNKHGEYATNVVKALQKKYGIKKINMVGHSLGNISIIYYMLQNGNKKNMPQIQKQQVKVLNIIGDTGNGSDGRVENISSLSLQYLVGGGKTSYKVLKVNGKNAQHSKLHENTQVDRALINFLWNK